MTIQMGVKTMPDDKKKLSPEQLLVNARDCISYGAKCGDEREVVYYQLANARASIACGELLVQIRNEIRQVRKNNNEDGAD